MAKIYEVSFDYVHEGYSWRTKRIFFTSEIKAKEFLDKDKDEFYERNKRNVDSGTASLNLSKEQFLTMVRSAIYRNWKLVEHELLK